MYTVQLTQASFAIQPYLDRLTVYHLNGFLLRVEVAFILGDGFFIKKVLDLLTKKNKQPYMVLAFKDQNQIREYLIMDAETAAFIQGGVFDWHVLEQKTVSEVMVNG